jgi:hypothetical protein
LIEKRLRGQSVQSIIGATDTLQPSFAADFSAEMPIFIALSELRVSAVLVCIAGSLAVAGET